MGETLKYANKKFDELWEKEVKHIASQEDRGEAYLIFLRGFQAGLEFEG